MKYLVLWAQIQGTQEDWDELAQELPVAQLAASREQWDSLQLATGGWQLGPNGNSTYIDGVASKNVTMTSLLGEEGAGDEDPGYASIHGRGKWAIPWLEGDKGLLGPQLWLSRMVRHVQQAMAAGVTGLLAIHWRTHQVQPQLLALEKLSSPALCVSGEKFSREGKMSPACSLLEDVGIRSVTVSPQNVAQLAEVVAMEDASIVWGEFISGSFGVTGAMKYQLEQAFLGVDGNSSWATAPIPYVDFNVGVGVPKSDAALDETYAFIEKVFAPFEGGFPDAFYNARFQYWPDSFRLGKAAQRMKLRVADFDAVWAKIEAAPAAQRPVLCHSLGVPALEAVSRAYENTTTFLYKTLASTGDIGIASDLQTNSAYHGIAVPASMLA